MKPQNTEEAMEKLKNNFGGGKALLSMAKQPEALK